MKSVCLFGGSFDPVHIGHLLVARAALEELNADRVIFIPAAQSPFKTQQQPTPTAARIQMLRIALAGKPWTEVDEQEVRRGGVSYTVDTLRSYKERMPGAPLHYLIGQDNVAQLVEWREPKVLAELAEFAVIPRPGGNGAGEQDHSRVRAAGFKLRYLEGYPLGLSSSQIRERVRAGLAVDDLLPPGVGEAIRNNRLYL